MNAPPELVAFAATVGMIALGAFVRKLVYKSMDRFSRRGRR